MRIFTNNHNWIEQTSSLSTISSFGSFITRKFHLIMYLDNSQHQYQSRHKQLEYPIVLTSFLSSHRKPMSCLFEPHPDLIHINQSRKSHNLQEIQNKSWIRFMLWTTRRFKWYKLAVDMHMTGVHRRASLEMQKCFMDQHA